MVSLISWSLFPLGLIGQILIGHKFRKGYLLALFTQSLWLLYIASTSQWPLALGTVSYALVYVDAYIAWGNPDRKTGIEALAVRLWRRLHPEKV